jgi:hypothetical protein
MNVPMRPLTVPTQAELGLVLAAKYESDLRIEPSRARRRFHTVSALIGVAALVFTYDALSLILGG